MLYQDKQGKSKISNSALKLGCEHNISAFDAETGQEATCFSCSLAQARWQAWPQESMMAGEEARASQHIGQGSWPSSVMALPATAWLLCVCAVLQPYTPTCCLDCSSEVRWAPSWTVRNATSIAHWGQWGKVWGLAGAGDMSSASTATQPNQG